MAVYTELPRHLEEVDIVIAGGGTAGCIVAARLSDADPSLSILIVEGGQNNYHNPAIIHPLLFLGNLIPGSKTVSSYQANNESAVGGRQLVVPTGNVLGGGSSINIMMYSRAQRHDFDSWRTPGWTADDMIPYMKRLETYYGSGTPGVHGDDGPIQISRGTYHAERSESDFIQAAEKVGWPEYPDLQDLDTNNGVQRAMRFVGPDGRRQDTAHAYLHPRLRSGDHPNLHVLVESQIVRVLFDQERAVGVEFRPNPSFRTSTAVHTIKARKMVVLSCGTMGTPSVLERSGVGRPDVLKDAGIEIVSDLPGVGNNYQDHHLLSYSYRTDLNPNETVDGVITGRVNTTELIKNNNTLLGWNAQDITAKLRPSDAEVAALGADFKAAWNDDFKHNPNKPLVLIALISGFPGNPTAVPPGQYLAVTTFSVYPYSRGTFHITGPSVSDQVNFTTGFFDDVHGLDIKKHMWAYKKQREILRRMNTYRGEVASTHPPFSPDSKAALVEIESPLEDVQDIEYTREDDAVLEQFLRDNVGTTWHSLGTCKMAPLEEGGVVDASLSVYGVKGLKVADLSIPPLNVAANTAATALAIGEKAADIFITELGLGA